MRKRIQIRKNHFGFKTPVIFSCVQVYQVVITMMKKCATLDLQYMIRYVHWRLMVAVPVMLDRIRILLLKMARTGSCQMPVCWLNVYIFFLKKSLIYGYLSVIPLVLLVSDLSPNFYIHCRFLFFCCVKCLWDCEMSFEREWVTRWIGLLGNLLITSGG